MLWIEASTHGKNDRVFKIRLHKQLDHPASKHPATFWAPSANLLKIVYKAGLIGNY
jgi:hypothetical protein